MALNAPLCSTIRKNCFLFSNSFLLFGWGRATGACVLLLYYAYAVFGFPRSGRKLWSWFGSWDIGRDMHKNGGSQPFQPPQKAQNLVANCKALCFCWKFTVNLHHWAKFELIWPYSSREKATYAVVGLLLCRGDIQNDSKNRGSNFHIAWEPWGAGTSNFAQCCNRIRTWNWQNLKAVAYHSTEK